MALVGAEKLNMLAEDGGGPWFMAEEVAVAIAAIVGRSAQSKSLPRNLAQNDTETVLGLTWGSDSSLRFNKKNEK